MNIKWTCRAPGYYEATGYSGIALSIMHEARIAPEHGMAAPKNLLRRKAWVLRAGDSTTRRAVRRTLRQAKLTAEEMFG